MQSISSKRPIFLNRAARRRDRLAFAAVFAAVVVASIGMSVVINVAWYCIRGAL